MLERAKIINKWKFRTIFSNAENKLHLSNIKIKHVFFCHCVRFALSFGGQKIASFGNKNKIRFLFCIALNFRYLCTPKLK